MAQCLRLGGRVVHPLIGRYVFFRIASFQLSALAQETFKMISIIS